MMQVLSEKKMFSADEIALLLQHTKNMIGPYGLYQHATIQTPLLSEGYCTDDNARAIQALLHLKKIAAPQTHDEIETIIESCWQFILAAEEKPGVYYNFRSAQGEWLLHGRSDDMYARLFRSLAAVLAHDTQHQRQAHAAALLPPLARTLKKLTSARAWAEILIAVTEFPAIERASYQELVAIGVQKLRALWHANASIDWPWFESTITYANALFPHALLRAQSLTHAADLPLILRQSADWLITTTIRDGMFVPIGSNGWYTKGGQPSVDNQQPIEAGQTFDFLLDYSVYTDIDEAIMLAPYLWLYGKNTHQFSLVDPARGYCRDGLLATGPNLNCGAESLLAYLWAEIRLKQAIPELQTIAAEQRKAITATV